MLGSRHISFRDYQASTLTACKLVSHSLHLHILCSMRTRVGCRKAILGFLILLTIVALAVLQSRNLKQPHRKPHSR